MIEATLADVPRIVPLFRALHVFHAERLPLRYHTQGTDAEYAGFLQARLEQGAWIFMDEQAGCPVAYLMALPKRDPGDFLNHPMARVTLDHLYVAPQARALGIGGRLVATMEHKMRVEGFQTWVVGFNAFNAAADRFYAARGATPRGAFRSKRLAPV